MAATPRMSWAFEPRETSAAGRSSPSRMFAIGVGVTDEADQFAGNVAGVQVGEDQHVCFAGNLAVGAFAIGYFRTSAASTCNSPSKSARNMRRSAFCRARAVAARILPMDGCVALPLVEKDSIATRGRMLSR